MQRSGGILAVITMMAGLYGAPVINGSLTINGALGGSFAKGQAWSLELVSPHTDAVFTYCEIRNHAPLCVPNFGKTDAKGVWKATGTFTPDTAGTWVQWMEFPSGAVSNRIAFTVSVPTLGTLTINNSVGGNFTPNQGWILKYIGGIPNTLVEHCASQGAGAYSCQSLGTTDDKGAWYLAGAFPKTSEGGWVEWLRFTTGDESNPISFTVGTPVSYVLPGLEIFKNRWNLLRNEVFQFYGLLNIDSL
ncbi:MAG: hypothetical protein WC794_05475 [Candidatus Doudnabacteria bacterium]|jgi:hypothetical protein